MIPFYQAWAQHAKHPTNECHERASAKFRHGLDQSLTKTPIIPAAVPKIHQYRGYKDIDRKSSPGTFHSLRKVISSAIVLMTHITMSSAIAMGLLRSVLACSGSLLLGIREDIK